MDLNAAARPELDFRRSSHLVYRRGRLPAVYSKAVRRLVFNLHLYIALAAAAFVIVLGMTGAIMAFETELDRLFHSKLAYVAPQGPTLTLEELGAAVSRAFPGEPIVGYGLATSPDLSSQVARRGRQVYVNQHTGEILGVRPGGMDWLGRIHQLHLRLLLRTPADPGKKIMSWAGVAIVFLALSGLYLWWPYQRVTIKGPAASWRFWFDLHNAVGICSFAFLLVLAVTGVMIGFEETTVPLFYRITGSHPAQPPRTVPPPPAGARRISPDQAVAIARAALPGTAPFQINVPPPARRLPDPGALPGRPHGRRAQPGGGGPVHGERVVRARLANRAGRGADGDSKPRHPHRRHLGHAEQGADVAGVGGIGNAGAEWDSAVVETPGQKARTEPQW